jgi:hypothetical protein
MSGYRATQDNRQDAANKSQSDKKAYHQVTGLNAPQQAFPIVLTGPREKTTFVRRVTNR